MTLSTRAAFAAVFLASLWLVGCGTTKARRATEQLIVSDAVDQAIADIDFYALSGHKVYLDTQFINNIKGVGFVNADYIISSLRQQLVAADCRLQEDAEDATYIVEARVGTLGTDGHEIVYGLPANNALSAAAALVPNTPALPSMPEVSLARKDAQLGAAKLAVFAYERSTGQPVWQSGLSRARSTAQDVWVLGAGPFQRGSIYDGTQFAGSKLEIPDIDGAEEEEHAPSVAFGQEYYFPRRNIPRGSPQVEVAGFEEELPPVVDAEDLADDDELPSDPEQSEAEPKE